MKPSILLIQPSLRLSSDFIDYPYFSNLAVAQAAAVIREKDFEVHVVDGFSMADSSLHPLDGDYSLFGAPIDSLIEECGRHTFDLVLIHYTPFHRPPHQDPVLHELLEKLRSRWPDTPLALADLYQSGEHYIESEFSEVYDSYPQINGWLKHEAEDHLVSFCMELLHGNAPVSIDGGEVQDLDSIPFPAWDLIHLPHRDRFLKTVVQKMNRPVWEFPIGPGTFPMLSSRGCPYRCGHCSSNPGRQKGETKGQRRYSADYISKYLKKVTTEFKGKRIFFLDEMVNVETNHFDTLLQSLNRYRLTYDFPNGMRADHIKSQHIEAMRGKITTLSVSAESGSQRVVNEVVGKRLELPTIEKALELAQGAGIPTMVHFIIGNPGETKREINETLEFALQLHENYGAWPSIQFATPLPGTRLEKEAQKAATLPIIHDFGPVFQKQPVTTGEDFSAEELTWFKWTFDQRLHAGRSTNKIIMNVTYKCNNRCTFCAVGTRTQLDGSIERQAEILANYRKQGVFMVDFDGGEPTLYPDLLKLIRYARKIGYTHINVTSNGRMSAYPDYGKKLVNSGLTTLLFSVHGPDEKTHTQQVGEPDAFQQTMDGIRNSVRYKPESVELGMNITLTRTNMERLEDVTQLAWDQGLKWLNIQFLTPIVRETNHVNPATQEAANKDKQVIEKWRHKMKFQVINLPFCYMPGYEEFLMGDLLKLERHMAFVNNDDVNLFDYLKERRAYKDHCNECPHKIFCGGFYQLDDVPEPPWVIEPADVYAPLA